MNLPTPKPQGPDHPSLSELGTTALMANVQRPHLVMARGLGSYLWDEAGKEYLDFIQGWAVNSLGHCPSEVREALQQQATLLLTPSPTFHNRPALDLAASLVGLSGAAQVNFVNSGAEANETAIKLARKWGRRYKGGAQRIITTLGAFHGRTLATMAASGKPGWDALFPPVMPGFDKVPFGDARAMSDAIDSDTVAIMVEPIQGEAGVVVPPPGYLKQLRQLCDEHGLLLILDEVQTGVGRTGRFLAQQHEGVVADITTLGKGLGSGVPVACVLANERASCFEPGDHGSTFGGNPLMLRVAASVVHTVSQPAFLQQVSDTGALLARGLTEFAERSGRATARGVGLLHALKFDAPIAPALAERARHLGLLVNAAQSDVLRFMPQLRVTPEEVQIMLDKLHQTYFEVRTP